jgi:hypothetical protein
MARVTLQTIFQDVFSALRTELRTDPSLARPRPHSRAGHPAVPDSGAGGAMCKPVRMAMCRASGTMRVGTGRVRSARISRANAD